MDPSAAKQQSEQLAFSSSTSCQRFDDIQDEIVVKVAHLNESVCVPIFFDVSLEQSEGRGLGLARSTSWPLIKYPSTQHSWLADDAISIPKYNNQLDKEFLQILTNKEQNLELPTEIFSFPFHQHPSSCVQTEQIQLNMEQTSKRDVRLKCSNSSLQKRKSELQNKQHSEQRNGFDMIINVDFQKDIEILSITENNENMCYEAYWENEYVKVRLLNREFQMEGENQLVNKLRSEMQAIYSLHHTNIVRVYGACLCPPNVCIIEDLCSDYINLFEYYKSTSSWTYLHVIQIAHVMAQALGAIHKIMAHGDVRLQSFIIKPPASVKITNYIKSARISRLFNKENDVYDVSRGGCIAYMAPEVIRTGIISRSADIYSFGVVLWEMMSGHRPWMAYKSAQQLRLALNEGQRLIIDDSWPEQLRQILQMCLQDDPQQRHTASQLSCKLYKELCTYVDPTDPANTQPVAYFL